MDIQVFCTCKTEMRLDRNDVAVVEKEELHFGTNYRCPVCGQTTCLIDSRQSVAKRDMEPHDWLALINLYPPERLLEVAE